MKALAYLNKYFLKYRVRILLGVSFVIILNVFDVLVPRVVRIAFDRAASLSQLYDSFSGSSLGNTYLKSIIGAALIFGGLVILATLLKGIFLFATRQTIIVMSRYIEYDLKNEIYEHYQKLPSSFYSKNYTGDLMARISEDVSRVRMYLGPAIMYTLNMLFKFIMVISVMVSINPKLSLYVLLPLPLLSFLIYKISAIINKKSDKIQQQMSRLTVFGQEAFSGIRVIKSFGAEKQFEKIFEEECEEYRTRSMDLVKVNALFMPLMIMLVGMSTVITIFLGGREVIAGNFTYGNIAEFVIYVNMLTWPVASLGWVTAIIQRASASQKRINEFLEEKQEVSTDIGTPYSFTNNIEFNGVNFIYPDKDLHALKNIQFEIKKGEMIGIIGPTGSGKTSLANLFLRMNEPQSGKITIDGTPLNEMKLGEYRDAISYVPQDVFLFSETIEENIAFGIANYHSGSQFDLVEKNAKTAMVHNDIIQFKEGYKTLLGERGITVSGGQKQRIAIARALAKDSEIIILDDCLSAVDQNTETQILTNLKTKLTGKTSIVISHRISSVINADKIIVLDDGEIIQIGTPKELKNEPGYFKEIYEKQMDA